MRGAMINLAVSRPVTLALLGVVALAFCLVLVGRIAAAEEYKFYGTITALPATQGWIGDWTVSGKTVHVTATTRIKQERGAIAIGAYIEVEGTLQADGSITALEIEVRLGPGNSGGTSVKFYGTVSSLPSTPGWIGDWTVDGRIVHVSASTRIEQERGAPAVGVFVKVEGNLQTDGSINATKIEIKFSLNLSGGLFIKFTGIVESLPSTAGLIGDWTVSGRTVRVSAITFIEQKRGPIAVGARVEVEGLQQTDGSINAIKIEAEDEAGSSGVISFKGTIESLPGTPGRIGAWTVSGRTVHVSALTVINQEHGPVAVGANVEVQGLVQPDGSINALRIEVKPTPVIGVILVKFYGIIESLPETTGWIGVWTVSGRKVNVTAATRIDQEHGVPAVGRIVEVEGTLQADGTVEARKIEVKRLPGGDSLIEFFGKIEVLPATPGWIGAWTVSGRIVNVSATTRIKREYRPVAVGAFVEVRGTLQADGSINALRIEVKSGPSGGAFLSLTSPTASVSAASYQAENAAESIVAAFGINLATSTAAATSLPLPTSLGGVTVLVDGVPAPLFFVSPTQINYALPEGTSPGTASVAVLNGSGVVAQGLLAVSDIAPSLFTADASGTGAPAGNLLRVKPTGQQIYESLVRFDAAMNKLVPATIRRNSEDQLFLVLYGTGLRYAPDTDDNSGNGVAESIEVTIGGVSAPVLYAGPAPGFVGLDQINVQLPTSVAAGQNISVVLKAKDNSGRVIQANTVIIAVE